MKSSVYIFDPTASDTQSKVRGVGRYLQILKENFPDWTFTKSVSSALHSQSPILINPFFNFLQTPLVMKRVAEKQIAIIHDLIPFKYPKQFPIGIKGQINVFLNKLALKNYNRVITDSEASKKDIVRLLELPENKVTVIYPCLPNIFTNSKFKTPNSKSGILNTKYCLYVGDATWNKNLMNLAKAIKILNVTCIFVGKVFENTQPVDHPWQKEYKEFLEEIKDDKRFILNGFVSDKELIQLYKQAKVNVLLSRDEGFGFSYPEASSQKCPSVLADIPVLHEISNDQALFANPNDPHDIANAIGEFYWNDEKRNLIGTKAFERTKQFSSSVFKKELLQTVQ